jgi:hypothetical protein
MKQFSASSRLWPYFLFVLIFLVAGPARAGCTGPTGNERDMTYMTNYHSMVFCNGTTWILMGGGGGVGGGGSTLISTQTASASASLQFTNLPTSYNTLFLNCSGLLTSGGAALELFVGEGAGPTWETGAHYTIGGYYSGASSANVNTSTAPSLLSTTGDSTSKPASLTAHINNISSSRLYKMATYDYSLYDASNFLFNELFTAYWNNYTNPVTGLELTLSAGNIASGTCSLYGLN